MSDCGRYLITLPQQDCRDNLVFFTDLQALPDGAITGKLPLTQVIFKLEHDYEVKYSKHSVTGPSVTGNIQLPDFN